MSLGAPFARRPPRRRPRRPTAAGDGARRWPIDCTVPLVMRSASLLLRGLAFSALVAAAAAAQAPAPETTPSGRLFGQRCTSCHTIGGGPRVGPDLLGVTERRPEAWIRSFLKSPGAAIDRGDPTAVALFAQFNKVRMPEQNLTVPEIDGLLAFFKACAERKGCQPIGAPKLAIDATDLEVREGRDLFLGAAKLSAGGPACVQCHHVRDAGGLGGGTLGGDLTFAWARLHDKALEERLFGTPLEKAAYAGKPVSDEEKWRLRAYLASLSKDGRRAPADTSFAEIGMLSAVAALGAIGIAWKSRNGGGRA